MSEDNFNKLNAKVQLLLVKLITIFPNEPRLKDVISKFDLGRRANYKLPGQLLYAKLAAVRTGQVHPPLHYAARIEHCGIDNFDLKSLPFPELEHLDLSQLQPADRRHCWTLIRDIILLTGHRLELVIPNEVKKFNQLYRGLVRNLCVAFPLEGRDVLVEFERKRSNDPMGVCYEQFKVATRPYLSMILKNPEVFIATPTFLLSLPFVGLLPLEAGWAEMVVANPDAQMDLMARINDLLMCSCGMDAIDPRLMATLQQTLEKAPLQADGEVDARAAVTSVLSQIKDSGALAQLLQQSQANLGRIDVALIGEAVKDHIPPEYASQIQNLISGKTGSKSPFGNNGQ